MFVYYLYFILLKTRNIWPGCYIIQANNYCKINNEI